MRLSHPTFNVARMQNNIQSATVDLWIMMTTLLQSNGSWHDVIFKFTKDEFAQAPWLLCAYPNWFHLDFIWIFIFPQASLKVLILNDVWYISATQKFHAAPSAQFCHFCRLMLDISVWVGGSKCCRNRCSCLTVRQSNFSANHRLGSYTQLPRWMQCMFFCDSLKGREEMHKNALLLVFKYTWRFLAENVHAGHD